MKKNILFKAIKLNLEKDCPELSPFFSSINFDENKISLVFQNKIRQINTTTLQVEEVGIPTETINKLNQKENFLRGTFSADFYIADFDSDKLELISKIINNVDELTGEIAAPYPQTILEEEAKKIEIIKEQIAQSRKQADVWEADLENNILPALKQKRLQNEAFNENLIEARKSGLL